MSAPVNGTVPDPSLEPASNETNPSPPAPVAKGPPPTESVAPSSSHNPPPPAPPANSPPPNSEPNAPPGDSSSTPPPKPSEEDSSPPAPKPKPRDPPPVSSPPPEPSNNPPVQPLPPPFPSLSPPGSSISPAPAQTPPPSPSPPESQQPPPRSPPGETVSPPPPVQQPPSPQSPPGAIFLVPPPRSPIIPSPPGKSTNSSSSSSLSSDHKSTKISSKSDLKSNDGNGIIGITLAGVAIVVLFAFIFFCVRKNRKKKQEKNHTGTYKPSGGSFSVKSDGYYYRQAGLAGSSPKDPYYTPSPSPAGNGMRNNGGYGYQPGLPDASPIGNSKSWFTYEELIEMTDGFSHENLLGQGGFGCVYKGRLQDGREVAVKQLKAGGGQGEREFMAEVEIISRVHHRHLVSLEGYCMSENERLLVYEFVPNNTLEHHLHGNGLRPMDWANRVKIAIGSAKGLAYLHEDCHPRIIHRDIKSANILLDNSFEAKVADFGLAKLSNDTNTHISTRVMGTFGYLAPEYASSGKLTDRSDVFSFGVVLLELVTGRKPVDASQPLGEESLVEWARPVLVHALETGNITQLVDPRLGNNFVEVEMLRMIETAAACVRHSAPKRPRMAQVVRALDSEGEMPEISNGMKYGQSAIFEGQNTSIERFRRLAFGSGEFSSEYGPSGEFDQKSSAYSSEHSHSREGAHRPPNSWNSGEHPPSYPTSGESGIWVMNQRGSERGDNFHAGFGSHQ